MPARWPALNPFTYRARRNASSTVKNGDSTAAIFPPLSTISFNPRSTSLTASSIATGWRSLFFLTYIAASRLGSLAVL